MADANLTTPLDNLDRFLHVVSGRRAPHIVMESREVLRSQRVDGRWLHHVLGRVFNSYIPLLGLPGITDALCGFKLLSA